jgi:dipeptidyl aminopeptidase/acylaminoacyl peptidase
MLLDLPSRAITKLVSPGLQAQYVSTGHLVYGHIDQSLMAVRFDLSQRTVTGAPSPVLPEVTVFAGGWTQFSVSAAGTAVYLANARESLGRLVLVDSEGRGERTPATLANTRGGPRFSPDGKLIAFEDNQQIQVYDIALGIITPITFEGENQFPLWYPDGRSIAFRSRRGGSDEYDLYRVSADGSSATEPILARPGNQNAPGGWSRDGRQLLFSTTSSRGDLDLHIASFDDTVATSPYVEGTSEERSPTVSPDGRFAAYISNESGPYQVYVRTFPVPGERIQVSTTGGTEPIWAPDGRRLFYRSGNALLGARVASDPVFRVLGRDTVVADLSDYLPPPAGGNPPAYDVHPDGMRFVFSANEGLNTDGDALLTIVTNWFEELKERMGESESASPD